MRDLPPSRDLLALARRLLLDDIAPLVPPERRRDLRLAATAIAIALREAEAGDGPAAEIEELLGRFYPQDAPQPGLLPGRGERESSSLSPSACGIPHLTPTLSIPGGGEGDLSGLLARFATDLRKGAFETSESRERAARAILWRLTLLKLREGNPGFLAANGFA